jgi:hypothetical protein
LILTHISTVVPDGPGSIVTCCMSVRISAMPCPRSPRSPAGLDRLFRSYDSVEAALSALTG